MQVYLESEFKLRILLIENKDAEGQEHYDPKNIDTVLRVIEYPNSIILKWLYIHYMISM